MERLSSPENPSQSLNCGPNDIVMRLLGRQGTPSSLRVKTEDPGTGVLGVKTLSHELIPDFSSCAELGRFFKEIIVCVKEKGKPRGKLIHRQARFDRRLNILDAIPRVKANSCNAVDPLPGCGSR